MTYKSNEQNKFIVFPDTSSSIVSEGKPLTSRMSYDANGNLEYVGNALAGAAENSPVWRIKKLLYTGGTLTSVLYPEGSDAFKFQWSVRTSLAYI